jgi:hypothetical protein
MYSFKLQVPDNWKWEEPKCGSVFTLSYLIYLLLCLMLVFQKERGLAANSLATNTKQKIYVIHIVSGKFIPPHWFWRPLLPRPVQLTSG